MSLGGVSIILMADEGFALFWSFFYCSLDFVVNQRLGRGFLSLSEFEIGHIDSETPPLESYAHVRIQNGQERLQTPSDSEDTSFQS